MRHYLPIGQDQQFRDIFDKIFWHQWIFFFFSQMVPGDAFEEQMFKQMRCDSPCSMTREIPDVLVVSERQISYGIYKTQSHWFNWH